MENTKNGEFVRLVINRRLRGRGSPSFWRSLKLNPKFLFGLFLKWFQKRTTKRYEINVEKNVDKGMETSCYTTYGYVNNTSYMVSFSLRTNAKRIIYIWFSMNNLSLSPSLSLSRALSLSLSLSLSLRINNSALENTRSN